MPQKFTAIPREMQTREFNNFLNAHTNQNILVTGCAGSGKSIWAIHKAKVLQTRFLNSNRTEPTFLFIVYTTALRSFMQVCIEEQRLQDFQFSTYGKCFRPQMIERDGRRYREYVWNRRKLRQHYTCIIVDECQDFSLSAIEKLKEHCDYLYCFGDSTQSIYSNMVFQDAPGPTMNTDDYQSLLNVANPIDLQVNYRNTVPIAELVDHLHVGTEPLAPRCIKKEGPKPQIIQCPDLHAQCDWIINNISKKKEARSIGILCYNANGINEANVENIKRIFDEKQFNVDKYLFEDNDNNTPSFSSTSPKLMTFKSCKGLQFDEVYIVGCGEAITDNHKRETYVALTRACEELYILYSGRFTSIFHDIDLGLYSGDNGDDTEDWLPM